MKAAVYTAYGPPEVLSIADIAKPSPGAGQVLVRIDAAAVSATDVAARAGSPAFARAYFGLRRPKWSVLGHEFAGEIEAIGAGVTRFRVGDTVVGGAEEFGAHAEYLCLPEDGVITHRPATLSAETAVAILDGALTSLPFLRDIAKLRSGQTILVNGASGAVGSAAVQLAKSYGARVTAVCSGGNTDLVTSLGADDVIDHTRQDFTSLGRSWDVIFDAVAKSSFGRARGSLAQGGIYLTTVPSLAIFFHKAWTSRFGSRKASIAFTGLRPTADRARDLTLAMELTVAGTLVPVIDRTYPLEQIADAHRLVETGHKKGNVVIAVGHGGA